MILKPFTFATIRQFILREGDRKTYCNRYNDNPHLGIDELDIYLNPVKDISCDPAGEFDEIVFKLDSTYTRIRCEDDELLFDAADKPMLERYFALTIAHISSLS